MTSSLQAFPEQAEAKRGETRPLLECRLLESPHRGVKSGGPPQDVVEDPTDVVAQLVVVRIGEKGVRVGRVDGQERDDASDEEVERRRALALVDRETDRRSEQQDVTEGIRG